MVPLYCKTCFLMKKTLTIEDEIAKKKNAVRRGIFQDIFQIMNLFTSMQTGRRLHTSLERYALT
jgi:hypothetical protein